MILHGRHNHSLESAEGLGQLKITARTKNVLNKCFDLGMSADQVYQWMQLDMLGGDVSVMANNHLYPKRRTIYHCWNVWRKQTCGSYDGDDMFEAIEDYAKSSDAKVVVKRFEEKSFVCVIVTPLMTRVHKHFRQASEVVFVDTTSHIDQTNSSVTVLMCSSPVGALPLGVIISSGQDTRCYYEGS